MSPCQQACELLLAPHTYLCMLPFRLRDGQAGNFQHGRGRGPRRGSRRPRRIALFLYVSSGSRSLLSMFFVYSLLFFADHYLCSCTVDCHDKMRAQKQIIMEAIQFSKG